MLVDATSSWVGTSAPPVAEEEVEEICPDKGTFVHMWNCVKRSIFILWLGMRLRMDLGLGLLSNNVHDGILN